MPGSTVNHRPSNHASTDFGASSILFQFFLPSPSAKDHLMVKIRWHVVYG